MAFGASSTANSVLACWSNGYVGMRIKETLVTIQAQTHEVLLFWFFFLTMTSVIKQTVRAACS